MTDSLISSSFQKLLQAPIFFDLHAFKEVAPLLLLSVILIALHLLYNYLYQEESILSNGIKQSLITTIAFLPLLFLPRLLTILIIFILTQQGCKEYVQRLLLPHDFRKLLTTISVLTTLCCLVENSYFPLLPYLHLLISMGFATWRIRFENSWNYVAQCIVASTWLILPINIFIIIIQTQNPSKFLIPLILVIAISYPLGESLKTLATNLLKLPATRVGYPRARWRLRFCEAVAMMGYFLGTFISLSLFRYFSSDSSPFYTSFIIAVSCYCGSASLRLFLHVTEQQDPQFLKHQKMNVLPALAPFLFINMITYFVKEL